MDKQIQFQGQTEMGIFCQSLFGSSGAFEKQAGAPPFADWETGDALRKYISKLTKEDRKKHVYVLVNALGAGEYFGSNINADFFPWNALAHEGNDYGYKTFETFAHAYQHHKNKDPTRAFGVPVLSVLNHPMKRVELIVRLDRAKAKEEQADGIITRIEGGEFPDVSMGCKVPFDVCSICGQKSKTRFDYCQHMMPPPELRSVYGPNKILPDGRRIYVVNTQPKFFDISFVFIGADKTAKVMAKVASRGDVVCLGDVCAVPSLSTHVQEVTAGNSPSLAGMFKAASASCACGCGSCDPFEKLAEGFEVKTSEIVKQVPAGHFAQKVLPALESSEPDIKSDTLDEMAQTHPLKEIVGNSMGLGIVLKPHEFQRIVLIRMGERDFADELDSSNGVFRRVDGVNSMLDADPSLHVSRLIELLKPYLGSRSGLGEHLKQRSAKVSVEKIPLPTRKPIEHPLLDKVSAAYNGYRQNIMTKISKVEAVVQSDPRLREQMYGVRLLSLFDKTATTSSIVSPDSVTYLQGAYTER